MTDTPDAAALADELEAMLAHYARLCGSSAQTSVAIRIGSLVGSRAAVILTALRAKPAGEVRVRTCSDCNGAGGDGRGNCCPTCDGQGGVVPFYHTRPAATEGDGLRERLKRWRQNLAITQSAPIMGDDLHGHALDFVIEQIDAILTPAGSDGDEVQRAYEARTRGGRNAGESRFGDIGGEDD